MLYAVLQLWNENRVLQTPLYRNHPINFHLESIGCFLYDDARKHRIHSESAE